MTKRITRNFGCFVVAAFIFVTIVLPPPFSRGEHGEHTLTSAEETDVASGEWFKEKRLVKHLLNKHATHAIGRPIENHWEPIEVEFGINLIQVLTVNESAGQLVTNLWTHFRWRDPGLSWNRTALGIDKVRVPSEEIWIPDVDLYIVNSTGHLDWIPSGIFRSACEIDTFAFPFDVQVCSMSFRSLSMGTTVLKLNFVEGRQSMSLDSYVPNPEWEVIQNTAQRSIKLGKRGMKNSFYDLTFTLRLKRRSVFHRYVLVLPCVLLSLTAGVLFLLPPESPAKIQIGIFIFQGFFLLLNLLLSSTPPASNRNPTIGLYYSASMISTTVVMFACGFLVELHFRSDRRGPMSEHTRTIVVKLLAYWLFIPVPDKRPSDVKREHRKAVENVLHIQRQLRACRATSSQGGDSSRHLSFEAPRRLSKVRLLVESRNNSTVVLPVPSTDSRKSLRSLRSSCSLGSSLDDASPLNVLTDLIELRMSLLRTAETQSSREYTELIQTEWMIAAMVFDRIFFLVYITWIIISLYLLLPQEESISIP